MTQLRRHIPEIFATTSPFSEDDEQILDELFGLTLQGVRDRHFPENQRVSTRLSTALREVKQNVVEFVRALNSDRFAREFCEGFPRWNSTRRKACEELNEIGNKLHLHRHNSNISRLFSNCVSFLGGVALVSSATITAATFGVGLAVAAPLAIGGSAAVAAGSATSVGTSAVETILTSQGADRVNAILRQDREDSVTLNPWIATSARLANALQKIYDIDIARDMTEAVQDTVGRAMRLRRGLDRTRTLTLVVNEAIAVFPTAGGATIQTGATLINILVAIIMLRQRNQFLCDCSALTFRIVIGLISLTDAAVDMGMSVAGLITGQSAATVARSVGAAVARGTVGALSIGLDVAMVVMTSIDVHRGSLSEYGQKILAAAAELEEQRARMEEVYLRLRRRF